jgi:hypothetical protein
LVWLRQVKSGPCTQPEQDTWETKINIYRFGTATNIFVPTYYKIHATKKIKRKNTKPRKLNKHLLHLQELKVEKPKCAKIREENWKRSKQQRQKIEIVTPATHV